MGAQLTRAGLTDDLLDETRTFRLEKFGAEAKLCKTPSKRTFSLDAVRRHRARFFPDRCGMTV